MRAALNTKYRAVIVAFVILIVAVAILAVWPDARRTPQEAGSEIPEIIATAVYQCEGGKFIHAVYTAGSVQLELSDLRALTLPQAISASGARFATADESFVFWNKGDTAFIQENNILTFTDCIDSKRAR